MEQETDDFLSPLRFVTLLIIGFAVAALVLAVVGIYGVVSYSVSQRTHEIGVRRALGAQGHDVLKMLLGYGVKLAFLGVGVGVLAAVALNRVLSGLLYEVSTTDPATLAGVAVVLSLASLASSYLPAHRATKVDPLVALRYE